jgi:hypothetical protein
LSSIAFCEGFVTDFLSDYPVEKFLLGSIDTFKMILDFFGPLFARQTH